jgi:pantothenate kinase
MLTLHYSWFVSISRETAKDRLVKRHIQAGIETTTEAAALRAEENDLKNGDHIKENMISPSFIIESSDL